MLPQKAGQPQAKYRRANPDPKGRPQLEGPPPSENCHCVIVITIIIITTQSWPTPTPRRKGRPRPELPRSLFCRDSFSVVTLLASKFAKSQSSGESQTSFLSVPEEFCPQQSALDLRPVFRLQHHHGSAPPTTYSTWRPYPRKWASGTTGSKRAPEDVSPTILCRLR